MVLKHTGCQQEPALSQWKWLFALSGSYGHGQFLSTEIQESDIAISSKFRSARRELFVYRDGRLADIWDEKGAIPEVSNTMVHILYDDGLITAVIDERDAKMNAIIDAIRSGFMTIRSSTLPAA